MVAATTRLSWYGGSDAEPVGITAEDNAGITFNREDSKSGNPVTSALPIPLTAATFYSWPKLVALEVTVAGTTSIANRRIGIASPMPTGTHLYVQGLSAYARPAAAQMPADAGTDAAVPAGYTETFQNTPVVYHAASVSTAATGRNGYFARLLLGIDSQYAATGGVNGTVALPTYRLTFDEG